MIDRADALGGALVADAAAMGLHWLYDQGHIDTVANSGDVLFRAPDANTYAGRRGYFAHAVKRAGELSHYGESARLMGQLCRDMPYSTDAHRAQFLACFGPCGSYNGYADRPTKALVARMLVEGDALDDPSGMDDDQMPALCAVPGLFAANGSQATLKEAVRVISTHDHAEKGARAVLTCLELLDDGASLMEALTGSASGIGGELGELLSEALALAEYQPLETATRFGLACHLKQGLPVIWHLLMHAENFESVVRDNVRCGGDSCGRAMAIGAIAGVVFGVPETMIARLADQRLPLRPPLSA